MQQESTNYIEVFTDGACQGNPGPGGWGAILRYKGVEKELSGYVPETTNNRMELQAAIEALKAIKRSLPVHLYTDSEYLRKGMTEWLAGWKKNNWRTAAKKPVKNQDLWEQLDMLATQHIVTWHWVRGHNDHPENERADKLATEAIREATTNQ